MSRRGRGHPPPENFKSSIETGTSPTGTGMGAVSSGVMGKTSGASNLMNLYLQLVHRQLESLTWPAEGPGAPPSGRLRAQGLRRPAGWGLFCSSVLLSDAPWMSFAPIVVDVRIPSFDWLVTFDELWLAQTHVQVHWENEGKELT